ncbi:hypothetical protein [Pseudovibrio japonicus]|uniref:hypothetical protein n=1 Tax=Pseudovibrio japonicus TaxID=366534 RepID=UPI001677502E|nr:hypothetical protein [Pseudovibrio japonicus]
MLETIFEIANYKATFVQGTEGEGTIIDFAQQKQMLSAKKNARKRWFWRVFSQNADSKKSESFFFLFVGKRKREKNRKALQTLQL